MKAKILFIFGLLTLSSHALVITLESGFDKGVTDSIGAIIPSGSGYIGTGFFSSILDADLDNSTASVLGGDFIQFGSSAVFGFNGIGGVYQAESDGGRIAPLSQFDGKSIYTLLGNSGTVAGSTEFIIFKHGGVNPGSFQVDDTDANAKTFVATLGADGVYLLGGPAVGVTVNVGGTNLPAIQMARAVPEPSMFLLSFLGILGILRRKR